MKHLDLFSGIGGFALAAQRVWGDEYENIGFCDNNKFCQEVLKLRFPNCKIYDDIRGLKPEKPCDLLTGGFPCQPFSQAGKRRAQEDDRFLWPEMLRVIKESKPTWIIGENVAGIINLALEQVCTELEAEGYEVQPVIIPACAVNAPHRRDRVWIIAYRTGEGQQEPQHDNNSTNSKEIETRVDNRFERHDRITSDTKRSSESKFNKRQRQKQFTRPVMAWDNAQNSISERSNRRMENNGQVLGSRCTEIKDARPSWEANWLEVAAEFCGVDDGLPVELGEFKLTKAQHRAEQLKAYGNSIVPQVVEEIMRGIKSYT